MQYSSLAQNQFLGSGSFSNVYRVTLNQKVYALKKIHPYLLKDPSNRKAILKEVEIMKTLDHPAIIKFYDLFDTSDNQINLLLEYAQNGNLYTILKTHEKLSQTQTIIYIKQILSAIKYLHSQSYPILHRDIKPQNILLTEKGTCKLADFGSSNVLDEQRYTFAGTKQYMAPQILKNQSYGKEVDLWCLGVLICQMLTGTLPKFDNQQVKLSPTVSRPAQDVIKRLLHADPSLRMTLEQLENHIWLAQTQYFVSVDTKLLSIPTSKFNAVNRIHKIKELRTISTLSLKKTSQIPLQPDFEQQKLKLKQDQQILTESVAKNLQLVQYLAELKISLQRQKKLILTGINDYQTTKVNKITEIYRLTEKINEYENNIVTLIKNYPLKFSFELEQTIKGFMKKVDYLQQYVEYFPTKLQEQVLDIPEICFKTDKPPVISIQLLKLRTYMLNCQKESLSQLIEAKKKHRIIIASRQQ